MTVGALFALAAAVAGAAASPLKRCSQERADRSLCGHVTVPLDRAGVHPGVVRLRVRALPAQDGAAAETVLVLAGGPGQAAAPLLEEFAAMLGTTLRSRDLVVFDQRGTGKSGRLQCPDSGALAADLTDAVDAEVAACAAHLGAGRAHYTTADSVADIESVRAALGVEQLVLFGTSYGTKVALDYAAAYPQHVSRLVLDSVVQPGGVDPFMRMTLGSIPRVLRTLCAHGGCPFSRDPAADLTALAGRLALAPLRGRVFDGRGRPHRATLDAVDLVSLLLESDLDPLMRPALPAALRAAADGDAAPILRLLGTAGASGLDPSADSDALFLATTCEDGGVPWALGTPIGARSAAVADALAAIPLAQLSPLNAAAVRALGIADLCRAWPEAPIVQPHLPLPDVPALILSGNEDLRTPRADALLLASRLPQAQVLSVPETGHSVLGSDFSGCAAKALAAFLHGDQPAACSGARSRTFPVEALPPTSFDAVPRTHGVPVRVGRTLTALDATLADMFSEMLRSLVAVLSGGGDMSSFRWGGLRGGSVRITEHALIMRDYSYVPGMTVSGRILISEDEKAAPTVVKLTIGGRAAARGWLLIGEKRMTGRLGGHRIDRDASARTPDPGLLSGAASARIASRAGTTQPLPPLPAPLLALLGWD